MTWCALIGRASTNKIQIRALRPARSETWPAAQTVSVDRGFFLKKFSPNLLNGLICKARTRAKQSLLRWS